MSFNNNNFNGYRGSFLLDETYIRRVEPDYPDAGVPYPGTSGWFGGGYAPFFSRTNIDRLDFANDSPSFTSVRTFFNTQLQGRAAAGNNNFGWWGAGLAPGPTVSTVDRLDWSNDLNRASPRGPLTLSRYLIGALSNINYGWFAGGAPVGLSLVDRVDFNNDTSIASVRNTITSIRYELAGAANANYGWFAGGIGPAPVLSTVDRLDFANDLTTFLLRGNITAKRALAATSNPSYGWFAGGINATPAAVSIVERIDWANDSVAASTRGPLVNARIRFGSAGNANFGWFAGGLTALTSPSVTSGIMRIDYANDLSTASSRGILSSARYNVSGTSNYAQTVPALQYPTQGLGTNEALAGYGWFGAGQVPPGISASTLIDRMDFSNDSLLTTQRSSFAQGRFELAGTNNANYGWFGGGAGFGDQSRVERLDFSNDSLNLSIRGPLSRARTLISASGNSNYGWWSGGLVNPSTQTSNVDRVDFANDSPTSAQLRANTAIPTYWHNQTGNADYSWILSGATTGGTGFSTVYRLEHANDTSAWSTRGLMLGSRTLSWATSNNNFGYVAGGNGQLSIVDRVDFSNDSPTTASSRANLGVAKESHTAAGNSAFGWFAAGRNAALTDTTSIFRIDYSNDLVVGTQRGNSLQARTRLAGLSNYVKSSLNQGDLQRPFIGNRVDGTFGWFGGGYFSPSTRVSTVERIDFANDSPTTASPRGPLTLARNNLSATGNNNFGWFGHGRSSAGPSVSTVDRINWANDSPTTASPRGTLSNAFEYSSAAGNANYGWFAAGGGGFSTVQRIDFNNDLVIASVRGPLSSGRYAVAATGNTNYGWFGGGYNTGVAGSVIDRIDWSNDSPTTASPRGRLSLARNQLAATGNTNYGWWAGGRISGGAGSSLIDRVDFANDSPVTASIRGPLTSAKYKLSATGNANFGWFAGSHTPITISVIDRVDFSNDLVTVSVRGPLTTGRSGTAGASNYVKTIPIFNVTQYNKGVNFVSQGTGTFGWWAGGYSSGVSFSRIDRLDFANDTATATARGSLTIGRWQPRSIGNNNFGWTGGGSTPAPTVFSTIDRIDFSNDSPTSAQTRGPLSIARYGTGVAGNSNYGWWAGGFGSLFNRSTVDRLDFANDALATSVRGDLFGARQNLAAAGNANYGWYAGGNIAGPTYRSDVARIDFANDSPTVASARGFLAVAKNSMAAASNTFYAWFAGGFGAPSTVSTVERIDFANDSPTTASVRGSLTSVKNTQGGAGTANFGWFGGGAPVNSQVERIDYSNDLVTAVLRSSLTSSRSDTTAMSNYTK